MLVDLLARMRDSDSRILIPGYYDDVRPLSQSEREAVAQIPDVDTQLKQELALGWTESKGQPVAMAINQQALVPLESGAITTWEAVERGSVPLREFMLRYTREKDLALFVDMAQQTRPKQPDDLPMRIVIPAYILSELKTGFQIGAILFLPFLVIDMVTASVTTSIGMMQLPPAMVSAPFKILLFVLVDGWNLIIGSLMKSFYQ